MSANTKQIKNNHQTKPSFDYNKLDQLSEIILNTLKARSFR